MSTASSVSSGGLRSSRSTKSQQTTTHAPKDRSVAGNRTSAWKQAQERSHSEHSATSTPIINTGSAANSTSENRSTNNKETQDRDDSNSNAKKSAKKDGFFADFNVLKMVGAGVIGAVVGLGYSVVDQTILHKPKVSALPYTSTRLQQQMPDVLDRAEKFYAHKTLVRSKLGKQEFERLAGEMLRQSEYFAAIYAKMMAVHSQDRGVTPLGLEEHFSLKRQAKGHWEVIVQFLRAMAVLINAPENLVVDNDFNQLYEAFQNRFYVIHQSVLGAP